MSRDIIVHFGGRKMHVKYDGPIPPELEAAIGVGFDMEPQLVVPGRSRGTFKMNLTNLTWSVAYVDLDNGRPRGKQQGRLLPRTPKTWRPPE